jgi:hypothetical protein
MHLKTIQATAFKAVFEVLKDIINDVNVSFTEEGLTILTLDTARMNQLLEGYIRTMPEQYHWVHRRFKTRPVGEPGVY